ncbi:hypothetical protein [Endozoicomonas sp. GU-1]|uniref:hypothetical protein n=1 Tax=Endozoicomonas sp. GU-1 TaxID=3009078 RepID=UPI0022B2C50E|nr:hypothetical protein [Endozoicomonas sp. GU-1]WBA81441.1 hypothetical protein O2T12_24715 [Endozoicomonas sp. GU-1]WBA84388.1 hypothetical protein O3276_13875 [Endozoicomonas sp. GU-1]
MNSDILKANRLLYLTMSRLQIQRNGGRKVYINNKQEHDQLLQDYRASESFSELVHQAADGMDLKILGVSTGGLHLTNSHPRSLWMPSFSDYRNQIQKRDAEKSRLLLVHIAIGMTAFPNPQDLNTHPDDLGALTAQDVMETLEQLANADNPSSDDDDLLSPEETSALSDLRSLPSVRPDSNKNHSSWLGLINLSLNHLVESRYMFLIHPDDEKPEYRVSESYQLSLRSAASRLFARFNALLHPDNTEASQPESMRASV